MRKRTYHGLFLLAAVYFGCGPGTNPGDKDLSAPRSIANAAEHRAYAPIYASGQNGNSLTSSGCSSNTGRPCIKARASFGNPYGFDTNVYGNAFPDNGGAPPFAPAYAGPGAGAGKTTVSSGPRSPDFPRATDRDLGLMGRQPQPGSENF